MVEFRQFIAGLLFAAASISACGNVDKNAANHEAERKKEGVSVSEAMEIAKEELKRRGINYEGYSVGFFMLGEKTVITFTDRNSDEPGAHFDVIVLPDGSIFGAMPGY